MLNVVYFAHGMESGPWGRKIKRLGRLARCRGFHIESPDFRGMTNPDDRVDKLLALRPAAMDRLVLAGSSMGGYVAAAAAERLDPDGLFLMAPAVLIDGFGERPPAPRAKIRVAVHGWHDDVVPYENAVRFCREHRFQLHLLDCGHTLASALESVETLFAAFLDRVTALP